MGEKFLRTARSRVLFVTVLGIALAASIIVPMIITAFTAKSWWAKPTDGVTAGFIWTSLSQLLVFLILVIAGIFAFVLCLTLVVMFLFDTQKQRIGRSHEPPPFRTLRDLSSQYDRAITGVEVWLKKSGMVIRSPFRSLKRSVEDWIDRGEY